MQLLDFPDRSGKLGFLIFVNLVRVCGANQGFIGWYDHYLQFIDLVKLLSFSGGSSSHACQLLIQAEVILESDGG